MNPAPSRPTRRLAVRGLAWSAPVLTVASAAPALAASGVHFVSLKFNYFNGYGADFSQGKPTTIESGLQVQNVWAAGVPNATPITVKVSYPASLVTGGAAVIMSGTGWTVSGPTTGTTVIYTLSYSGSVPPGGSTTDVKFRVPLIVPTTPGSYTLTATASAPQFQPVSTTAAVSFS